MQITRTQNQPNFKAQILMPNKKAIAGHLPREFFPRLTNQALELKESANSTTSYIIRFNPRQYSPFSISCATHSDMGSQIHKDNLHLSQLAKAGKEALFEAQAEEKSPILYEDNNLCSLKELFKKMYETTFGDLAKKRCPIIVDNKTELAEHLPIASLEAVQEQLLKIKDENSKFAVGFNPRRRAPFSVGCDSEAFEKNAYAMKDNLHTSQIAKTANELAQANLRDINSHNVFAPQISKQEYDFRLSMLEEIEKISQKRREICK